MVWFMGINRKLVYLRQIAYYGLRKCTQLIHFTPTFIVARWCQPERSWVSWLDLFVLYLAHKFSFNKFLFFYPNIHWVFSFLKILTNVQINFLLIFKHIEWFQINSEFFLWLFQSCASTLLYSAKFLGLLFLLFKLGKQKITYLFVIYKDAVLYGWKLLK